MTLSSKFERLALVLCLLASLTTPAARAFSLLGPLEPWMTATNGFFPTGLGGPMYISNGYRWNVPVVTYGFDQSFMDYFGTNGVAAVENAISFLNNLPPASQINPTNYTDDARRYNYAAQGNYLLDLKSATLSILLNHLGLAAPDQFMYSLKSFSVTNGMTNTDVLLRNYDPVTDLPSSYVNGYLYSYHFIHVIQAGTSYAAIYPFQEDPFAPGPTAAADGWEPDTEGGFFIGLTADDMGGLAYLYSTNNIHFEDLPPDVQGAGASPLVDGAWRPGVDKVTFVPQPADPVTGAFLAATNQFTDNYITNGLALHQLLQRITVQPDFLFSATDLVASDGLNELPYDTTGTTNWINNAALNGRPTGGGPGVIQPPIRIAFNKLGPFWVTVPTLVANQAEYWGTFDGSTNLPIAYPVSHSGTNATPVRLALLAENLTLMANYRWLASGTNCLFDFQTSSNLTDWNTLFVVPNNGSLNLYYNESTTASQEFYRVVPQ